MRLGVRAIRRRRLVVIGTQLDKPKVDVLVVGPSTKWWRLMAAPSASSRSPCPVERLS